MERTVSVRNALFEVATAQIQNPENLPEVEEGLRRCLDIAEHEGWAQVGEFNKTNILTWQYVAQWLLLRLLHAVAVSKNDYDLPAICQTWGFADLSLKSLLAENYARFRSLVDGADSDTASDA